MTADLAKVLHQIGSDLRAERRRLTVGDLFDIAVQRVIESEYDWRPLEARRPLRNEQSEAAE